MNVKQKLDQFTEQQVRKNAAVMVVTQKDGSVVAFGKYVIKQSQGKFAVNTWDRKQGEFSSRRSALAWCSADRRDHYNLAREIKYLDQRYSALHDDLTTRTGILERSQDPELRENIRTKIAPKQQMLKYVQIELEKCLNRAKYIELKDFQNETARIFSVKNNQAR